jgi:hypothetical protein
MDYDRRPDSPPHPIAQEARPAQQNAIPTIGATSHGADFQMAVGHFTLRAAVVLFCTLSEMTHTRRCGACVIAMAACPIS